MCVLRERQRTLGLGGGVKSIHRLTWLLQGRIMGGHEEHILLTCILYWPPFQIYCCILTLRTLCILNVLLMVLILLDELIWLYMWPDLQKPGMSQECASGTVRLFSSSDRILSKSSFCHIHVKQPFYCYHRIRRVDVTCQGEITFTYMSFDLPWPNSCRIWSPLPREFPHAGYLGTARFVKLLYIR